MSEFSKQIIQWQHLHGRHDLPWQGGDAYRIWLSEIMLQQTQVATVIPYYQRFLMSFPTVASLAAASEDQVLALWSGLGYYARGRNLHRAAQIIVETYHGELPPVFDQIIELPGIGRSTAAAICALAFHQRYAILDGNVKRLLARYCGIEGWTGESKVQEKLWQQAEILLPSQDIAVYIQAQMDLGAAICTRSKPKCNLCPVQPACVAFNTDRINQLPTPRPRKIVPEKHTTFMLLMHGKDILLEKRASIGIWGGLWCPPQIEDGMGVPDDYLLHNKFEVEERIELSELTHVFTHFKLHITPVLLRIKHKPLALKEQGSSWINVADALEIAIPAPVRVLLEKYCIA